MTAPRPVLLFDGDCAFCTSAVGVVERLRRAPGDFAVLPWQRADLPAYGLTPERCTEALQWVGADGRASSAQDAVITIAGSGLLKPSDSFMNDVAMTSQTMAMARKT